MKLVFETTVSLYLIAFVTFSKAKSVNFFQNKDRQGNVYSVEFEGLQCHNIEPYFNNTASSADTFENCIIVYDDNDCEGRNATISTKPRYYLNLRDYDFDDKITSFRQCDPDPNVFSNVCHGVEVEVDYSDAPDLKDVALKMKQTIEEWYPRTCRFLWSGHLVEERKIHLDLGNGGLDVVHSSRNVIFAQADYFRRHPDDMGKIVHEMAKILQGDYKFSDCPRWLHEGIADFPRRWLHEKENPNEEFKKSGYYDIVKWIEERWHNTIYRLNVACRRGTYDKGMLQRLTGKVEFQLEEQMKRGC